MVPTWQAHVAAILKETVLGGVAGLAPGDATWARCRYSSHSAGAACALLLISAAVNVTIRGVQRASCIGPVGDRRDHDQGESVNRTGAGMMSPRCVQRRRQGVGSSHRSFCRGVPLVEVALETAARGKVGGGKERKSSQRVCPSLLSGQERVPEGRMPTLPVLRKLEVPPPLSKSLRQATKGLRLRSATFTGLSPRDPSLPTEAPSPAGRPPLGPPSTHGPTTQSHQNRHVPPTTR